MGLQRVRHDWATKYTCACTDTHTQTHTHTHIYLVVQSLSCVQLFVIPWTVATLWDTVDCSTPGFPVPHYLPKFVQVHVHWISDAIQPSHPVSLFFCLQSSPASESFLRSQFFTSGAQSVGASASVTSSTFSWVTIHTDLRSSHFTVNVCTSQRIDGFELRCWRRPWRVPWTARRSNHPS